MEPITITDPVYHPPEHPGPLDRFFLRYIRDPRDLPFLYLIIRINLLVVPAAVYLYLPGRFSWWLFPPYAALLLFFTGPYLLMLHNTSHRPLFKRQYRTLNKYIPWALGPLFGQTPESFFAHHVGMHHAENNLRDDISSTMPYHRDRFLQFVGYNLRFALGSYVELAGYFHRRRRYKLMRGMLAGELAVLAIVVALAFVNWQATLVVLVWPLVNCRWAVMATNWAQHAFIDPKSYDDPYGYSITLINCAYNRRCFNDGYHIGHHVRMTRHWTEMPGDFEAHREEYARRDAVVFEGIDYLGVWLLLMLKRYDKLADRFVQLGPVRRSREEIMQLLESRTLPVAPAA